ncbi:MAG: precorrin-3B C(17)-methyltransferase [Deltaproteobacteria bacterium]|jgi:precorrin-3B C17-methyltransferase|nr:precorrin-3B C(17)-methyltransferase [Deltaproteobacteria bacterium]
MSSAPLYVVGLGPGSPDLLPPRALHALEASQVLIGYQRYLDLLPPDLLCTRRLVRSGMTDEISRCNQALDAVLTGETVSLVCSGDPGVYAMAGLVYELAAERGLVCGPAAGYNALCDSAAVSGIEKAIDIRVVPGIPALCAAAALLGAPLMHDFASLSLSDLLTPWELIEKRAECALAGDFVLVIYNPRSGKRTRQLERVLEMALAERGQQGVIGLVRNAERMEQVVELCRLADFDPARADMLSIIFIGNSQTRLLPDVNGGSNWRLGARMVTPRGYLKKYQAS